MLFDSPDFTQFAQPLPSRIQRLFDLLRKGEHRAALECVAEIKTAVDQIEAFIHDEL